MNIYHFGAIGLLSSYIPMYMSYFLTRIDPENQFKHISDSPSGVRAYLFEKILCCYFPKMYLATNFLMDHKRLEM